MRSIIAATTVGLAAGLQAGPAVPLQAPAVKASPVFMQQQTSSAMGSASAGPPYAGPRTTPLLDSVKFPRDMRSFTINELKQLANELRWETINAVSKTGGHLGSSLGVVELTVALHYVFNTPEDPVIWDVSHQVYPHKILTGRRDREGKAEPMGASPRRARARCRSGRVSKNQKRTPFFLRVACEEVLEKNANA